MYKVFIQNSVILFENLKKVREKQGLFYSESSAVAHRAEILSRLNQPEILTEIVVFSTNPLHSLNLFFKNHDYIEAAGGIVQRKNSFLFIKRNGTWDLPKGKIDEGESPEEAAFREIEEECGIRCSALEGLITESFHVYDYKGTPTIKKTFWYDMRYEGSKELTCQVEEGITKALWVPREEIQKYRDKTFASLKDVIQKRFEH